MLSIGQFAHLAQVSIRTLRLYDERGLLKPARVGESTGYRVYEARQLRDLNRVLVLKELGLSLQEIGRVVAEGVSGEELVGMLRLRQAEAQQQAEHELERLERVAARIESLATSEDPLDAESAVVVKSLEAMRFAAIVKTIDDWDELDFPVYLPEAFQHQYEETVRLGMREPTGPIQAHFVHRGDGRIDVITGVPVHPDEELDSDLVVMLDLPAIDRAATLVRQGDFSEGDVLVRLTAWLEANGETQSFDHYRQVYLQAHGPADTWVAENQFVLKDPA